MTKPNPLDNARTLNEAMRTADEATCRVLIKRELLHDSPRKALLGRIHSRLNKLRAGREREELLKAVGQTLTKRKVPAWV